MTREERVAYIAQCEASVMEQRKQVAEFNQKQLDFDTMISNVLNEVVSIVNEPLQILIMDIKKLKSISR